MKNELYIVRDVPRYAEDAPNYCYVVRSENANKAIEIVKRKTGHNLDWEAEFADNDEVWD